MDKVRVEKNNILVSVCCLAYNHEKFIRQCLNGFMMQKTNFRFEVLIHDDASTDKTVDVIHEYESKYPDIIRPIYQKENQYSKGVKVFATFQYPRARGKYIALCEGDDYWTDPYKLQNQIDFLETHPDYSMCFHNAIQHIEDDTRFMFSQYINELQDKCFSRIVDRDYSGPEIYRNWIVPTASVVCRKAVLESDLYKKASMNPDFMYGDIVLFLSCSKLGKMRGFSNISSVYRRHSAGVTILKDDLESQISFFKKQILHSNAIIRTFGSQYRRIALEIIEPEALFLWKNSNKLDREYYLNLMKKYPFFVMYVWLRRLKYWMFHEIL